MVTIDNSSFLTYDGGNQYGTGCLPRTTPVGSEFPEWTGADESCPLVEKALWKLQEDRKWIEGSEKIDYNQGSRPSCTFHSCANLIQLFFLLANRELPELDPVKAWTECTGGSGGYPIDGALTYCRSKGFPTNDGGSRIFLKEAYDCPSGEAAFSAAMRGFLVHFGWSGLGPHAEGFCYVKDANTARIINSWGKSWGERGWHDVSFSALSSGIRTFGAWALREFELRKEEQNPNLIDAKP